MKSGNVFPESKNIHSCPDHQNEIIKFFCNDHQQACCSVCVGTKHRKCESVDTVDDAAKHIKQNGELDVLLGDVKNLERKLTEAKSEQEKSLTEVENSADEIIEKTEREFKELVDYLEMLKNKHLEEVTGALKKGREKLSNCINVTTDGIQTANYCCRSIEKVKETENNTEMVMTFYRMKEKLLQLKAFEFTKKQIIISEARSQVLKEVRNMESFGNVEYSETNRRMMYDVNDIALSLVSEFRFAGDRAWCGNVLSNGTFAVADHIPTNGKCFIYSKDRKHTEVIDGLSYPFEVKQDGEELLVTCYGTESIEVFSASDLQKLRSIKINEPVYGITQRNGAYYVASANKIIKTDESGIKLEEYTVEGGNNVYICATKDGHLVYSNFVLHTVTAITDQGDTVWQYTNPRMNGPHGLEVDSVGNIFVAAKASNNIHVLFGAGNLIRIIEDIPKPVFIKLMEERGMCCVCSDYKIMKMYKL